MLALAFVAGHAAAVCPSLRLGYVDHDRAPYFLGTGSEEAKPAGAAVDLVREAASIAGCKVTVVRLPQARLRNALKSGAIDAMAIEAVDSDRDLYALPLDAAGKLDQDKALRVQMVVFVRASDTPLRHIDPARDFGQRWMGSNYASPQVALLRKAGFNVDDGALDPERNLEKLMRNRIDGYAISLASPGDLDNWVAARFGNADRAAGAPASDQPYLACHEQGLLRAQPHAGERDVGLDGTAGPPAICQAGQEVRQAVGGNGELIERPAAVIRWITPFGLFHPTVLVA